MDRFLKNQWKKAMVAIMLGVTLCGNAVISVHAATTKAVHICAYSYMRESATGSEASGTHKYVISTTTKTDGTVEIEYGTCQRVTVRFVDVYQCACGATKYINPKTKTYHAHCGMGWEE